jgi:hypothetical protein
MTSRFSSPFHGGESDDDALFGSSSSRAVAVPMPTPPSSLMTRYAVSIFEESANICNFDMPKKAHL